MRNFFYVIVVTALSSCATNPLQGARFWAIEQCSNASAPRVNFPNSDGGTLATVPREYCSNMKRAVEKIGYQARFPVENLYIASVTDLNAFATHGKDGKRTVIVTMGMLQALGSDEEAWAGLFGHEIAHLVKRHGEGRAEAKAGAQAGGQAIGNVIAQLLPGVGGFIAGNAANFAVANAMYGAYTRPQESEADEAGLHSMVAAGYDPRGMRRLFEVLRKETSLPAFLSTHPGADDRMQVVEQFIASSTGSSGSRVALSQRSQIGTTGKRRVVGGVEFEEDMYGDVRVVAVNSNARTTLQPGDSILRCSDEARGEIVRRLETLAICRSAASKERISVIVVRNGSLVSAEAYE